MNKSGNAEYIRAQAVPTSKEPCFACGRPTSSKLFIRTKDGQSAFVGADCFTKVRLSGSIGYQPPAGGPRLFSLEYAR